MGPAARRRPCARSATTSSTRTWRTPSLPPKRSLTTKSRLVSTTSRSPTMKKTRTEHSEERIICMRFPNMFSHSREVICRIFLSGQNNNCFVRGGFFFKLKSSHNFVLYRFVLQLEQLESVDLLIHNSIHTHKAIFSA